MIDFKEAPPVIRDFMIYNETIKGKSASTSDGYYRDLRTFFRFIKHSYHLVDPNTPIDEIDISDVDMDLIEKITLKDGYEFLYYCKNERHNNEKTRSRKVSTLKSFFKYLTVRLKVLKVNPMEELEAPKLKKSLPKYLTLDQCLKLLKNVDGPFKERNYAIFTIFLNCGLRLSELCSLNLNDIHYDEQYLRVTGKGNKERIVYLNDACMHAIKTYLATRKHDSAKDKNALFLSRTGSRISRRMVEQIVYDCLEKSGLAGQGFSAHKLRHTAATLMYQQGNVDIRILQEILGHENLGTTEIYTHLSNEQIKHAADANPLAQVKQK